MSAGLGYGTGGSGGTATAGGYTVGGGGGGASGGGPGSNGGSAAGGIFNTGTLNIANTTISNNLGAGGGGGGGYNGTSSAANGGKGVGGIWNSGGTVNITAASFSAMSNKGGSGTGGSNYSSGGPGSTPTAVDNIYNAGGTLNTSYVPNNAPTTGNLAGDSVAWAGVGSTVRLDSGGNASFSDVELGALNSGNGNWNGASLTVQRSGTAASSDSFGFDTSGALFTVSGSNLQSNGSTFATFANAGGVLTISATSSGTVATTALMNDVARHITYRSDTPAGDATVRFTLSDGSLSTTADVTVTSDTIYVTNATDTTVIDPSNGVSFSEAIAIAAADSTGSQTLVIASSLAGQTVSTSSASSLGENITLDLDSASGATLSGGTLSIGSGKVLTISNGSGDTATLSTTLNGSGGGLVKAGSGTITLSGSSNAYTGATEVSGGTLALSGGTAMADSSNVTVDSGATLRLASSETVGNISGAGAIDLGSTTLTVQQTADTTFSGDISGTGGLTVTQSGAATYALTLSGTNTFTGNLAALNFGWIKLDGDAAVSSSGSLRFNGNSKITLLSDQTVGDLSSNFANATLDLNGFTLTAGADNADTTASGAIIGSGSIVKQGSGTMTLSSSSNAYTGTTTVSAGTLSIAGDASLGSDTVVLNGGTLDISGATTIDNAVSMSAASTIHSDVNVTLSGAISGSGDLSKTGSGTLTLSATSSHTGATTVSAGTLSIAADSNLGSGLLTLAGGTLAITGTTTIDNGIAITAASTIDTSANATLSGALGGSGTLTKAGASTLTLSGTNTHTGAVTVSAGGLTLSGGQNLGDSSAVTVSSGATLTLSGGGETIGSLAGAGNVVLGYTLTTGGNGNNTSFSGVISSIGTNGIVKNGSGTFTLTGANSYTGSTTINAGSLAISGSGSAGSGSSTTIASGATLSSSAATLTLGSLAGAGTLSFGANAVSAGGNNASTTFSGAFGNSSSGTFSKTGTGTLTLSGSSSGSDAAIQVSGGGRLVIAGDGNLGGGTLSISGSTLQVTGSDTIDNAITLTGTATVQVDSGATLSGAIGGTGNLVKTGAGSLGLSGANNATGTTTVSAGTLSVDGDGNLGSGMLTLGSGTTLLLNSLGTVSRAVALAGSATVEVGGNGSGTTLSGVISGTGSLTKTGASPLMLSGTNSYTGTTTVSAGQLIISSDGKPRQRRRDAERRDAARHRRHEHRQRHRPRRLGDPDDAQYRDAQRRDQRQWRAHPGRHQQRHGDLDRQQHLHRRPDGDHRHPQRQRRQPARHRHPGAQRRHPGRHRRHRDRQQRLADGQQHGQHQRRRRRQPDRRHQRQRCADQGRQRDPRADGNNTYTGATTISAGTLYVNNDNALGSAAGGTTVSSGASLRINGSYTIADAIGIAGLGVANAGAIYTAQNVGAQISGAITLNASALINVDSGSTLTLSGPIGESGGARNLSKGQDGTLVLSGTSSYSGTTTVSAGTLAVTGSIQGGASVASGATLAGTGTIGGLVTVQGGGTLAPGVDGTNSGAGILTLGNGLTMQSGSTLAVDIAGASAGSGYDQLIVTGAVDVSGATLSVNDSYAAGGGDVYTLISNDAADAMTGNFSGVTEGSTLSTGGNGTTLKASYLGGTGNDFTLAVPPIPHVLSVSSLTTNDSYGPDNVITIAVNFSEAVFLDGGTLQLTLETGSTDRVATYFAGSGGSTLYFHYTVQAGDQSPDLDYASTTALQLTGGTLQNASNGDAVLSLPAPGTTGSLGDNAALVIDGIAPTASIVVADTALKAGETSLVTITFSEVVNSFTLADLSVANGVLGNLASSDGITWTATLTPGANITDASNLIRLDMSGVRDYAFNTGVGTTDSNNYAIDTQRPTASVVVADSTLLADTSSLVTITFNEAVTGFTTADMNVVDGTLSGLSSSDGGTTWTATLTPVDHLSNSGNVVTLDLSGVQDLAGNAGSGTTDSNSFAIDTRRPEASSIVIADSALKAGETSIVTISFSEAVTGLTLDAIDTSGIGTMSGLGSSDGGLTWTATLTPTADAESAVNLLRVDLSNVHDQAGNAGSGISFSDIFSVDTRPPTAAIVVNEDTLNIGASSSVTITFSEAVTGFTAADLTVANGTLSGLSSSDGGRTWTATLTPDATTTATDRAITLDNTTVSDLAGNAGAGSTVSNSYNIDTQRPAALSIVVSDSTLSSGETATVTIRFGEAVTGLSAADLSASHGTLGNFASKDGGLTWTATLTPDAGVTAAGNTVTLDLGGVQDLAGNAGAGSSSSAAFSIDTVAPTATGLVATSPSNSATTNAASLSYTLSFSEAVSGLDAADLSLAHRHGQRPRRQRDRDRRAQLHRRGRRRRRHRHAAPGPEIERHRHRRHRRQCAGERPRRRGLRRGPRCAGDQQRRRAGRRPLRGRPDAQLQRQVFGSRHRRHHGRRAAPGADAGRRQHLAGQLRQRLGHEHAGLHGHRRQRPARRRRRAPARVAGPERRHAAGCRRQQRRAGAERRRRHQRRDRRRGAADRHAEPDRHARLRRSLGGLRAEDLGGGQRRRCGRLHAGHHRRRQRHDQRRRAHRCDDLPDHRQRGPGQRLDRTEPEQRRQRHRRCGRQRAGRRGHVRRAHGRHLGLRAGARADADADAAGIARTAAVPTRAADRDAGRHAAAGAGRPGATPDNAGRDQLADARPRHRCRPEPEYAGRRGHARPADQRSRPGDRHHAARQCLHRLRWQRRAEPGGEAGQRHAAAGVDALRPDHRPLQRPAAAGLPRHAEHRGNRPRQQRQRGAHDAAPRHPAARRDPGPARPGQARRLAERRPGLDAQFRAVTAKAGGGPLARHLQAAAAERAAAAAKTPA